MIKILKPGIKPAPKKPTIIIYTVTCSNCITTFEFDTSDIVSIRSCFLCGDTRFVVCPTCGHRLSLALGSHLYDMKTREEVIEDEQQS